MKKLFSLLTALALSLALALSVSAAGTPTIIAEADNDALKRGDTFYVTVSLDNNPGICLMQVAVVFNEKVFEFVDVENGTLITSSLYAPDRVSGAKLDWEPGKDIFGDGKLARLKFKVRDDAEFGESTININSVPESSYNDSMVEIDWKSSEPIVLTVSHEHVWDEGTVTKPATCGEKGEKTYTCTVEGCDEKKVVEIPATGEHTRDDGTIVTAPTCGEPGVKKFTCKVCGADLGTEPINPTGEHIWGNWEETLAPTCSAKGRKTRTCTVCSATETEDVPMVDHAWDDGKVTTQADKDQPGVKTFTCTECGATKTESIPALGDHVWDEGTVTREPTCAEEGVRTYTCTICGETKEESIEKTTNHVWNDGEITKAPDCIHEGEKTYTCTLCSAIRIETVAATGEHTWDEGKVTKAATCAEEGEKTYTCKICGATKLRRSPPPASISATTALSPRRLPVWKTAYVTTSARSVTRIWGMRSSPPPATHGMTAL